MDIETETETEYINIIKFIEDNFQEYFQKATDGDPDYQYKLVIYYGYYKNYIELNKWLIKSIDKHYRHEKPYKTV